MPRWPQRDQFWLIRDAFRRSIFHQVSRPAKPFKLQHVYCENLFFHISGHLLFASTSYHHLMFFRHTPLSPIFGSSCLLVYCMWKRSIFGPLQKSSGLPNCTKIYRVAPKYWKYLWRMLLWAAPWNVKTWRNAEWIGPSFCLCLLLFALSSLSGIVVV